MSCANNWQMEVEGDGLQAASQEETQEMTETSVSSTSMEATRLAVQLAAALLRAEEKPSVADAVALVREIRQEILPLVAEEGADRRTPAVPVEESVSDDWIVCLEDGKRLKLLKRYLMTHHGMTPQEYRAKWGLPPDYPMAAPSYSRERSAMARKIGLGRKRR
jgi:predicted transcriptional regulator